MAAKDALSLVIGGLALVVSIVAFVISIVRGRWERERTLRSELSDVLRQLTTTIIESQKLFHEFGEKDTTYYRGVSEILDQQQTFLHQQAMYLADQIPDLITSVEYTTIAVTNASVGDFLSADKYHRRAVGAAPGPRYKLIATRAYAEFLFSQQTFEEGRDQYRKALSNYKGDDDRARYSRGETYQMWGDDELNLATSPKRAEELFESAAREFRGISSDIIRNNALTEIEAAKQSTARSAEFDSHPEN